MTGKSDVFMEAKQSPPEISGFRYSKALKEITLLKLMNEIDNHNVRRIIDMLNSSDPENWTMAEEFIKNKLTNE